MGKVKIEVTGKVMLGKSDIPCVVEDENRARFVIVEDINGVTGMNYALLGTDLRLLSGLTTQDLEEYRKVDKAVLKLING